MNQQLMRCDTDCEIPATANACGLSYDEVAQYHDEINGDFRDNLNGSPFHIQSLLNKLGKGTQTVTDDDILSGRIDIKKVILLVHSKESPFLMQHWCNVDNITEKGFVGLSWNYPTRPYVRVSEQEFRRLYREGWPNCAFLVTESPSKLPWYARFWVWITGIFG